MILVLGETASVKGILFCKTRNVKRTNKCKELLGVGGKSKKTKYKDHWQSGKLKHGLWFLNLIDDLGRGTKLTVFPIMELSIFGGFKSLQKLCSLLQLFLLLWIVPLVLICQYFNHARQCLSCCVSFKESKTSSPSNEINSRFTIFITSTVGHFCLQIRVTVGKSFTQIFILNRKNTESIFNSCDVKCWSRLELLEHAWSLLTEKYCHHTKKILIVR